MHVLTEKFFFQFLDIDYFSNCDNGEAPEVRIDDDRLCVCVANDADAGVSDRKSTRLNSSHMPKSRMPSSA